MDDLFGNDGMRLMLCLRVHTTPCRGTFANSRIIFAAAHENVKLQVFLTKQNSMTARPQSS